MCRQHTTVCHTTVYEDDIHMLLPMLDTLQLHSSYFCLLILPCRQRRFPGMASRPHIMLANADMCMQQQSIIVHCIQQT